MSNASGCSGVVAAGLLVLALTGCTAPQPAATAGCAPGAALRYVCGPARPEDILAIPGTPWLVASGYAAGAGLKLIDARSAQATSWYSGRPEQLAPDRPHYPHCTGPVDPAQFNARGLSLRRSGRHTFRLHVVNHGGRESIEVFDIDVSAARPALRWRGCLPTPQGQVANSVATFSDGTVLLTVLTRTGTTITDFVRGGITGAVYQWPPDAEGFRLIEGTELPGNNGLETSPDDRQFYVVAFGWHAVVVYDRHDTSRPAATIVAADFMPDNIHWSAGRLLAAGMRLDEPACGGVRRIVDGEADRMLCHRGYTVAEVDVQTGRMTALLTGTREPAFNGVSAAALSQGKIWIGSYQSDRLAYAPAPQRAR